MRVWTSVRLGVLFAVALVGAAQAACRGTDLTETWRREDPAGLAALEAAAAAMPYGRGRLFRVTKAGVAPSYLYGTIHLADPRVTAFSTETLTALKGARIVALELAEADQLHDPKVFEAMGPRMITYMLARSEERGDRLLPPADFARLEAALIPYGLPPIAAKNLKPSFLALMLSMPACAVKTSGDKPVVDALLARKARAAGARVVGLETIDEQLESLTGFPVEVQARLIAAMVRVAPQAENLLETLIRRYEAADTGFVLALARHEPPGHADEAAVPPEYLDRLLDERNVRMRDRARPLLAKGGAFIAVGAAHLPGEKGLAHLIEAEGYKVERLE